MGREIKRVALDFDWPLNKRWEGFLSPDYRGCPACHRGGGEKHGSAVLSNLVRMIALACTESLTDRARLRPGRSFPHPWLLQIPFMESVKWPNEFSEIAQRLVGDLDPIDIAIGSSRLEWKIHKKLLTLVDLPEDWGTCETCQGTGAHPEDRHIHDDIENGVWKKTEPPKGEGWQMWGTVSEGSPITPVFATADELIDYMVEGKAKWGAVDSYSREAAEAFVKGPGWAPSFVGIGNKLVSGVEALALPKEKSDGADGD